MKRNFSMIASVPFVIFPLSIALIAPGCSSAEDDSGGTGGSSASTGGTSPTGGTTTATGGDTSSTGGTTSSGDMCMATASPTGCSGISRDGECPTEGQNCAELPCGVSDVGRRECNCTGLIWDCTDCAYPMDFATCPIMEPPASTLEDCVTGTVDGVSCASSQGSRCMNGTEVCICWPDDENTIIWDCDKPPSFW